MNNRIELKRKGLLLIISSPSGAGKTTLARKLLGVEPDIIMSVSVTTRPKRSGERPGIDYNFIKEEEYQNLVDKDELLEHAQVFDYFYGTPKAPVDKALAMGKDMLFDIDWQGAEQLAKKMPEDIVSIFILPPSLTELEKRLRARDCDEEEVISRRMAKANSEISHFSNYKYVLINNDVETCLKQISSILRAERLKLTRQLSLDQFVENMLNQ